MLTELSTVPAGTVSVIAAGPAGKDIATLHELPAVAPAGITTGVPATLKVKFVPTAMPAPATLQTCNDPFCAERVWSEAIERIAAAASEQDESNLL